MAAAAILHFLNLKLITVGRLERADLRRRAKFFVEIAQIAAEIWSFFDFQRWRPPPSWIFKFLKI